MVMCLVQNQSLLKNLTVELTEIAHQNRHADRRFVKILALSVTHALSLNNVLYLKVQSVSKVLHAHAQRELWLDMVASVKLLWQNLNVHQTRTVTTHKNANLELALRHAGLLHVVEMPDASQDTMRQPVNVSVAIMETPFLHVLLVVIF
jgi:hypothetical protein